MSRILSSMMVIATFLAASPAFALPAGGIVQVTPAPSGTAVADPWVCWMGGHTYNPAGVAELTVNALGIPSGRLVHVGTYPSAGVNRFAVSLMPAGSRILIAAAPAGGQDHELLSLHPSTGALTFVRPFGQYALYRAGPHAVAFPLDGPVSVDRYDRLADLIVGSPAVNYPVWGATRAGSGDTLLPVAWHSTDTIDLLDPVDGSLVRSVLLQDFDTWVVGLQQTHGRLFVIDDGRSGWVAVGHQMLSVFDEVTGANLMNFEFVDTGNGAFYCGPNRPGP